MATISEALAIAIQHHQAGRLQAAEQIYRQILAIEPNQADALHFLGVIAHQVGKHAIAIEYIGRAIGLNGNVADFHNNLGGAYLALRRIPEADACYRRALELNPDYADAHNNLGNALRDQGKLDEAVARYRQALELKPGYVFAHNNLGNALRDQGKLDEAVASYRRALALQADCAEAHNNLAVALNDQRKPDEAIACYRRALELKPDYADAHNNLGVALRDQGKLDEAVACYRRALALKSDDTTAYNNLGVALRDQGNLDDAVACYRRALALKSDYTDAYNNLGIALNAQGKPDEAIACYRQALELKPDYADAYYNLGNVLEVLGDLQGAENYFRLALRHNSRFALAHYQLAELLGDKLPEKDLAAQRRLVREPELTGAQRLLLHFGLAQVLDARGEYDEAAEHLDRGNALQLSERRKCGQEYDQQPHAFFITQMISVCTPEFFERVRGFGLNSELPVFVFGLPRSGTTLIEQILASHSCIHGSGELSLSRQSMEAIPGVLGCSESPVDCIPRLDSAALRRLAVLHEERLKALAGRQADRIVDKMPNNYLYLGLLAALFPQAIFIHCRRDLRDVAVSCWMTRFQDIRWASDQQHIASRFHEYQRLMEHWRKVLPVPLLEVDYEETVADLEGVARKIVAWCGLAWEPTCLEFHRAKRPVRTASVVQVRRPVFRTSVGRWKHYDHALGSLFARLESGGVGKSGSMETQTLGQSGASNSLGDITS